MKIKEEHYDILKSKIDNYLDEHPEIKAKDALENTRLRWDIYWHSKSSFSNAQEYNYLDDNNIDSALKSILRQRINN